MRLVLLSLTGMLVLGTGSSTHAAPPFWEVSAQPPAATLGKPIAASLGSPRAVGSPVIRATSPDPLKGEYSPAAQFGPASEIRPVTTASFDPSDTPPVQTDWNNGDFIPSKSKAPASHSTEKFGEHFHEWFDDIGKRGAGCFPQSDHAFDNFISPLTSPYYAEDPRSLTEIRPLFIYQTIPKKQTYFQGGNLEQFAIQGRLAITERFSLVLHELGVMVLNPGSGSIISGGTGITQITLGPKYTWYRDEQTGTIAAAGVQFQLPIGSSNVFQDTGTLSVVPYVNFGQKFWRTSFGEMAFMSTVGYSFSTNTQRSDFFYANLHLDYDIGTIGKFYPVLEMNWFHYTTNGQASNLGIEGHDIANIGSAVKGRDFVSIAPGFRYKFSERWQAGIYTEFPLLGTRDIHQFRLGLDMIWRY